MRSSVRSRQAPPGSLRLIAGASCFCPHNKFRSRLSVARPQACTHVSCGFQDIVKRKHIRMIPDLRAIKAFVLRSRKVWTRSCIPAVGRLDRSVPGYVRSNNWSLKVVSGFAVSSARMALQDKLSLSSAEVKGDGGHR